MNHAGQSAFAKVIASSLYSSVLDRQPSSGHNGLPWSRHIGLEDVAIPDSSWVLQNQSRLIQRVQPPRTSCNRALYFRHQLYRWKSTVPDENTDNISVKAKYTCSTAQKPGKAQRKASTPQEASPAAPPAQNDHSRR